MSSKTRCQYARDTPVSVQLPQSPTRKTGSKPFIEASACERFAGQGRSATVLYSNNGSREIKSKQPYFSYSEPYLKSMMMCQLPTAKGYHLVASYSHMRATYSSPPRAHPLIPPSRTTLCISESPWLLIWSANHPAERGPLPLDEPNFNETFARNVKETRRLTTPEDDFFDTCGLEDGVMRRNSNVQAMCG